MSSASTASASGARTVRTRALVLGAIGLAVLVALVLAPQYLLLASEQRTLAGLAGAILGSISTFSPAAAGGFTLQSFVIAVLGGLGNMWGALVGGLMLGVVQAWSGQYLGGTLINAVAFAVLVIVLVVRPEGLLGKPYYAQRVEV